MKNFLKDYFAHTASERNGSVFLVLVLSLIVCGLWFVRFIEDPFRNDLKEYDREIEAFIESLETKEYLEADLSKTNDTTFGNVLFRFDPNTANADEWGRLGFSEKQVSSILKYINAGGVFKVKTDVKKLYVVSDEKYSELEEYIQIEKSTKRKPKQAQLYFVELLRSQQPVYRGFDSVPNVVFNKHKGAFIYYSKFLQEDSAKIFMKRAVELGFSKVSLSVKGASFGKEIYQRKETNRTEQTFDLNEANLEELKRINGIGDVLANRIIRYRKLLGGFYDLDQLEEVYGIESNQLPVLRTRLLIDSNHLYKININKTTVKELSKHPYLNWNVANSIVQIREKKGGYVLVEGEESDLVNEELYLKIVAYLKVD